MSDRPVPVHLRGKHRLYIGSILESEIDYVRSLHWKWCCITRDGDMYRCLLQFKDARKPPKGGGIWCHPDSLREALRDLLPEIIFKVGKLDACSRNDEDMYALRYFPLTKFWTKSQNVYCPPIFHIPK